MEKEDLEFILELIDDYYEQMEYAEVGSGISLERLSKLEMEIEKLLTNT